MRHWYWASVHRGDEEIDTNANRVESILTAHEMKVDIASSDPSSGHYMVLLPEFPPTIEIASIELSVGELTVRVE